MPDAPANSDAAEKQNPAADAANLADIKKGYLNYIWESLKKDGQVPRVHKFPGFTQQGLRECGGPSQPVGSLHQPPLLR